MHVDFRKEKNELAARRFHYLVFSKKHFFPRGQFIIEFKRWVIIFKAHIIVDFDSGTKTQKRLRNNTVSIEIWHPNNNGNLMFPKISKLKLSMKAKK